MYNFNLNFIPKQKGIYIVGGSVRDAILGCAPKDYDIAVTAGNAAAVACEIAEKTGTRVIRIGKADKMIYRIVSRDMMIYDISAAKDNLIEKDLARRDFTINAMAFDVLEETLIDPLNGRNDLETGTVRMVRPETFADDPLRMLRAFRFASALQFDISPETLAEISKSASCIESVPGERTREEWIKLLSASGSFPYLLKLDKTGLLGAIFPELCPLKKCVQSVHHAFDVFRHTLEVYRHLEALLDQETPRLSEHCTNKELVSPPGGHALLKHTALLHDIGKPSVRQVDEKGKTHFYGHENAGSDLTEIINNRLRFSTVQKNYVSFIVRHHLRPLFLYIAKPDDNGSPMPRTRFFAATQPFTTDLLLFFVADMMGKGDPQRVDNAISFANKTLSVYFNSFYQASKQPPLITGMDLIRHFNLEPSPLFSEILEKTELRRLAGKLGTRNDAIRFAKNLIISRENCAKSKKR